MVDYKKTRDEVDNIIISDFTLRSLLPPQFKNIIKKKVMCGCKCCISAKIIHSSLLPWRDHYLKKIKDISQNAQNRRSGGKANHLYEIYKNTFMVDSKTQETRIIVSSSVILHYVHYCLPNKNNVVKIQGHVWL